MYSKNQHMKYLKLKLAYMALIIIAVATSCTGTPIHDVRDETSATTSVADNLVEVVYFQGKQRCLTCRAIERFAKETVDSCFGNNEAVAFKIVDINTPDGERIADTYEIAGSALLIIKESGGKISYADMTPFAFQNARKNIPVFKKGIEKKVNEYLN